MITIYEICNLFVGSQKIEVWNSATDGIVWNGYSDDLMNSEYSDCIITSIDNICKNNNGIITLNIDVEN